MKLIVEKWGDSFAIRLPDDYLRQLGVKEGDAMQVRLSPDGSLNIRYGAWNRSTFASQLRSELATMPESAPVVDSMRNDAPF